MCLHYYYYYNYFHLFLSPVTARRNDTTLQMTVTDSSVVEMVLLEIVTASLERETSEQDWHERVTCYGTYKLQERLVKMGDLASTISAFCRFVEQTDSAVVLDVRILHHPSTQSNILTVQL